MQEFKKTVITGLLRLSEGRGFAGLAQRQSMKVERAGLSPCHL